MKHAAATIFIGFFAILLLCSGVAAAQVNTPGQVNRLRVSVSTTSDWTRINVPVNRTIINYRTLTTAGSPGVVTVDTNSGYLFIGKNSLGNTATAEFDILLDTDGVSDGIWQISKGWGQSTHVDIYNLNDLSNPILIAVEDDTAPQGDPVSFVVKSGDESRGGPLSIGSMGPKKVFAVYYPWWTSQNSWTTNPYVGDSPLDPYDTQDINDVDRLVLKAKSNGVDGFLASWQGKTHFSDVGFRTLLSAANRHQDFTVAVYLETRVANQLHDSSVPPDPAILRQWIADVVSYANDPANTSYLKMDGKPVVFIYWAKDLTPWQWKNEVFDPLRSQGIDAFYIADYTGSSRFDYPAYLEVFNGMHMYNPSPYSNIPLVVSTRAIETKTYHLLVNPGAERKLWVGTVVPGMDARKTGGSYVDRAGGNEYRYMWDTNLNMQPDWVMITTWNEYYENTYIEETVNYGRTYLDITRDYASRYKSEGQAGQVVISNLKPEVFLPGGMEVSWQTNLLADSVLEYGVVSGIYTASVRSSVLSQSHRIVAPGLQPGAYFARVKSTDATGAEVVSPEFCLVVPSSARPGLVLMDEHTYWPDLTAYLNGLLAVDFKVTNGGPGSVNGLVVNKLVSSDGVAVASPLPLDLGDLPAGESRLFTVRWKVPPGVSIFRAEFWGQATREDGLKLYYPDAS